MKNPTRAFMVSHCNAPPVQTKNICVVQSLLNLASQGNLSQAVTSLELFVEKGFRFPSQPLVRLLRYIGDSGSLREGRRVHVCLRLTGLKRPGVFLANHLIGMYFKCGSEVEARQVFDRMTVRNLYSWNNVLSGYAKLGRMEAARAVFDQMPERDFVSWNTMVVAFAQRGFSEEALRFYRDLRRLGIGYNEFSFSGILTVCVKLNELELTRQVHGQVLAAGFSSNLVLLSSVVDAYTKCGEMRDARRCFDEMPARDVQSWTTMVSGYAKLGDMKSAVEFFDRMPEKNPVSWSAMISGYARNGMTSEALSLFAKMTAFRITPEQFALSSCLCACASLDSLRHGKQIHGFLMRSNSRPNAIVVSSLVDMYAKCGRMESACRVFDLSGNATKRNVVLWNTTISALASRDGRIEEAIQMFENMLACGVKPNGTTFLVVLNACSRLGLVQEGLRIFESMERDHGIVPEQEHYVCK